MEQFTQCRRCGMVKSPSDFYSYRRFVCKACVQKQNEQWRKSEAGRLKVIELKATYRRRAGSQPMEDQRRVRNLVRRLGRARRFAVNTCPASRMVALVGRALAEGGSSEAIKEDPREVGELMLWTVLSLWRARDQLGRVSVPAPRRSGA